MLASPSPKSNPIYISPTHHWGVGINDSNCNNDDDKDDDVPRPGIIGFARGREGRGGERRAREERRGEQGRAEGRGWEGKGKERKVGKGKGAGGISGAKYFNLENGFDSNRSA